MTRQVLLIDDDASVRDALGQTLELASFEVRAAGSFVEAKDHILADFQGVILSDIRMPGRDGFHLLDYAQGLDADLPVILLTGEGDIPMAVRAMSRGAFGFLEKPCSVSELTATVETALGQRAQVLENRRLKRQLETGDPAARMLFGHSPQAEAMRAAVRSAARAGAEVLVTGPAGSGIAKVAEAIHLCSAAHAGPFVKRSGSGLSRTETGTIWTDCIGGTLFLDEIGSLPTDTQLALVDALDQGGARLIAGSTQDLADLVSRGAVSAELFYRLDVARVRIPSLSERREDIPVLFRHYVAQAAEQSGIPAPDVTQDHAAALMAQDWPGNARSLMSAAMRFVLGMPEELSHNTELGLAEQMAQVERALLAAALGRHNGRASAAAEALQLPRKTFYDKLGKYGLKPETYRRG